VTALLFIGGGFDFDRLLQRLTELNTALDDPKLWQDPEHAKTISQERSRLEERLAPLFAFEKSLQETEELLHLSAEEEEEATFQAILVDLTQLEKRLETLEFQQLFSGENDRNNAYLDVQSGSGGTEAQDWAEMLLRMYLRWGDQHGFKTEILDKSPGEVAGIKGATVRFSGEYAYGWLRTETGVHRLVRKSPFDSGNRRHTSFASVFVYPEIDDNIAIEINPADLRVDTYRASGAGGQHVQKTDSAVRMTHVPTGIIVQCQTERSQHQNRARALKQMRAKLYEMELQKKLAQRQVLEESKTEISWGSQIRSYVLDQSRIKDLRTGLENSNTQAVLDGDLDEFMLASLKYELVHE
jgi:peptide chain release factor 2